MNKLLLAFLMSFTLLISACGGGSGGGFGDQVGNGTDPVDPPVEVPPDIAVTEIFVGNGTGAGFTVGVLGVSQPNIGATEKTNLEVTIVDASGDLVSSTFTGTVNVIFQSNCILDDSAVLSKGTQLTTDTGRVTNEYTPTGCSTAGQPTRDDVITAIVQTQLLGNYAVAGTVTVAAPTVSTIKYIPATADNGPIFLGLAGTGLSEQAPVQFKVIDTGGNPVPNVTVEFELVGATGDTSITQATAISNSEGLVTTTVVAGTVHDSAIVDATISSTTIGAKSNQLWIGTGLPTQNAFSISTCENMEGGQYDGETEDITVILSDRFGNPVPENTVVTFTAEGGQVQGACNINFAYNEGTDSNYSFCDVTYTSADPRPDGTEANLETPGPALEQRAFRANVLAYAVGEESYVDVNGSGTFDDGDLNQFTNLSEAYLDENENGQYDTGERYIETTGDGAFSANNDAAESGSGLFNGVLCEDSDQCSVNSSTRISSQVTMIHSTSSIGAWTSPNITGGLFDTNDGTSLSIVIPDSNGNPLPAGTTVKLTTDNGKTFGETDFVYPCTTEPRQFNFIIAPDEATDPKTIGPAQIVIETPRGNVDVINFSVYDGAP